MVLIIVLSVIAILVLWTLWTPLRLYIDTRSNTYKLSWGHLVTAYVQPVHRDFQVVLSVAGARFRWSVIELIRKAGVQSETEASHPDKKATTPVVLSRWTDRKRLHQLLDSFRVRKFHADLDTGNYVLNAMMYPLAVRHRKNLNINFNDKNSLQLAVENRPVNILKAMIV